MGSAQSSGGNSDGDGKQFAMYQCPTCTARQLSRPARIVRCRAPGCSGAEGPCQRVSGIDFTRKDAERFNRRLLAPASPPAGVSSAGTSTTRRGRARRARSSPLTPSVDEPRKEEEGKEEQNQLPARRALALNETSEAIERLAWVLGHERPSVRNVIGTINSSQRSQRRNDEENMEDEARDPADVRGEGEAMAGTDNHSAALQFALDAAQCPVCLDTYHAPITLPCGHSLCCHHGPKLRGRACPICRRKLIGNQWKAAKDATLAENVRVVVRLAGLVDTDRDTVRNAAEIVGRREEEGGLEPVAGVASADVGS